MYGVVALGLAEVAAGAGSEQFVPMMVRGAQGKDSVIAAGLIDYLALLNARDGGVNGVRFSWETCESGYDDARGLECYERFKARSPALVHPLSIGLAYTLLERAAADRIPLVTIGYGRADAAEGRVFPYAFPLLTTYWSQAGAIVRYIGVEEGGFERLQARTLALLHQDSAHGREAIPAFEALAAKYGFTFISLPVLDPGDKQQAQWEHIRELRPDWVILWGRGAMNSAALESAARIGYPRGRMVGAWWAGTEEDVEPAGAAAKEFVAAAFTAPGTDFPVIRAILDKVYGTGSGALEERSRVGSMAYNRGVAFGIVTAEAVAIAQQRFGKGRPVSGEQVQWALERLDLDEKRLQRLGAEGFMPALRTSCTDHEGAGEVRFLRWDGMRWNAVTDWVAPLPADRELLRRKYSESALRYANEHHRALRSCSRAG